MKAEIIVGTISGLLVTAICAIASFMSKQIVKKITEKPKGTEKIKNDDTPDIESKRRFSMLFRAIIKCFRIAMPLLTASTVAGYVIFGYIWRSSLLHFSWILTMTTQVLSIVALWFFLGMGVGILEKQYNDLENELSEYNADRNPDDSHQ